MTFYDAGPGNVNEESVNSHLSEIKNHAVGGSAVNDGRSTSSGCSDRYGKHRYVDSVLLVVYLYFLQAGRGSCFWNVEKVKKILHFYTHSNYLSFVKCHYIAIVYC